MVKIELRKKISVFILFGAYVIFAGSPLNSEETSTQYEPFLYIKTQKISELYPKIKNAVIKITEKMPMAFKDGMLENVNLFFLQAYLFQEN